MSGSLGALVVSLAADTAKFRSDIGKAAQQMARLGTSAAKMGAAVAANVVGGARVFGGLIKNSIDSADAMSKASRAYGISTEALSELGYAAKLSGLAQEDFQGALGRLAKKSADAAGGLKEAKDAFAAMDISTKKADGTLKSTEELLGEMADKFAGYEDGAAKTALAMEFFGKSGAKMIPFLNEGRAGLEKMRAEVRSFGGTLTKEGGESAEGFNDNLERLQVVQDSFFRQVANQLSPTLNNLTTQLLDSAKAGGFFQVAVEAAATAVKLLISGGTLVSSVLVAAGKALGGLAAAAVAFVSGKFSESLNIIGITAGEVTDTFRGMGETLNNTWGEQAKVAEQTKKVAEEHKKAAPVIKKVSDTMTEAQKKGKKNAEDWAAAMQKLNEELQDVGKSDLDKKLSDIAREGQKFGANSGAIKQAQDVARLTDAMQGLADMEAEAREQAKSRAEEATRLYGSLRTPVENYRHELEELNKLKPALDAVDPAAYGRAYAALADAEKKRREDSYRSLVEGLMTENEAYLKAFEDRRALILENTEITETQRQELLDRLNKSRLEHEAAAELERFNVLTTGAQNTFGALADISKAYAGEQSGAYRALFAISKGFAIAQSAMSIATGLAKAQELGFPANIAEMARVAAAGASIVAAIQGANFSGGYDKGGYIPPGKWGIVGERGMEAVSGPANVTGREQTAQMLKRISEQGSQPRILQVVVKGDGEMSNKTATQQGRQIGMGIQRAMSRNG